MSPGSPQKIVEDFLPPALTPSSQGRDSLLQTSVPDQSGQDSHLHLAVSDQSGQIFHLQPSVPHNSERNSPTMLDIVPLSTDPDPSSDSAISADTAPTGVVSVSSSPPTRSGSFSWGARSRRSSSLTPGLPPQQVGTAQPIVSPPPSVPDSPKILLHDFYPNVMLSTFIPTDVSPAHNFHNLVSSIFLNNLPCSQKSLVHAMAESLEDRGNHVLHGIQLPADPGLVPSNPLHMALYLYVSLLFQEFEDYYQAESKAKHDLHDQLQQKIVDLRGTQDQLVKLREVNALLAKSNAPTERVETFRLQQECRRAAADLQAVTQDFNEVKAHMENLQRQLEVAEQQKSSAAAEAQDKLELHQAASAELSQLRVKIISMTDRAAAQAENDQLQAQIEQAVLERVALNEEQELAKAKEQALNSEVAQLRKNNRQISDLLEQSEKEKKSLKTNNLDLTGQVSHLSKERDATLPSLQEAKLAANLQKEEKVAWEAEKKSFLQTKKEQEEKISSLQTSLETLKKKKASVDSTKEVQQLKEMVATLGADKTNLIKQTKEDSVNFFARQTSHRKKIEEYEETLRKSNDTLESLDQQLAMETALKKSLEEEQLALKDQILDLQEALQEKTREKGEKEKPIKFDELRKRFKKLSQVVKELTDSPKTEAPSTSASDIESDSEDEVNITNSLSRKSSHAPSGNPTANHGASPAASPSPPQNPSPQQKPSTPALLPATGSHKKSYGAVVKTSLSAPSSASASAPSSQSSHDDTLQIDMASEEKFPEEEKSDDQPQEISLKGRGKREASPLLSPSPENKRQNRSSERSRSSSQRDSRSQGHSRHYDLDRMSESYHNKAFHLIKDYKAATMEALSNDKHFIECLRSQEPEWKKSERIQRLLKAYATCTTLKDISDLNVGIQPDDRYGFQPIPNLSIDSPEWHFIENTEKNKFIHFPSFMALVRIFCSKLYVFFHFGKQATQPKKKNTIHLLHTADRDQDNAKRSDWEKKLDLLLTLLIGRVVFYTLDDISPFTCNPDSLLYLTEAFLTQEYVDQMISTRSYRDVYLLPKDEMINLYVVSNGAKARAFFNYRIPRYEPAYARREDTTRGTRHDNPAARGSREPVAPKFSWAYPDPEVK